MPGELDIVPAGIVIVPRGKAVVPCVKDMGRGDTGIVPPAKSMPVEALTVVPPGILKTHAEMGKMNAAKPISHEKIRNS